MNNARIAAIEKWFREHDDGDFSIVPAGIPSVRGGETLAPRTLIYTTKQYCLPRIEISAFVQPVATLARYGLPSRDDLDFLRGSGSEISRLFFGDADPPDLLVFAWLREHLPIQWAGVSDDFLNSRSYAGYPGIHIRLSDSERAAVAELGRLCPDYRKLLGDSCASLLENGMKIELEGALAR
ncbi:MAG: hypothetical protein K8R36_18870 [Planctomycetales bacterium]|nr:hypothetical protein [Planctomycetales bacterium]